MRKHCDDRFKAEAVLEVLHGEKTLAEVASERQVHVTMLHRWRQLAVEGMPKVFAHADQGGLERAKGAGEALARPAGTRWPCGGGGSRWRAVAGLVARRGGFLGGGWLALGRTAVATTCSHRRPPLGGAKPRAKRRQE